MLRWIRLGAVVSAIALSAVACGGGGGGGGQASSSGGKIVEGGILRIGDPGTIDSLNPFVAFNQDAFNTFFSIYPYLVQYDQNLEFAPDFATSWETSSDGLTWTFHTVPDAKWSDGQPLTAEDVAYTYNLIIKYAKGPTGNSAQYVAHMTSAEATDANTVVLHYKEPVGNVLSQLEQIPILPQHIWSQHEGNDGKDLKTFDNAPPIVSGGPFTLTDYSKRDFAKFATNPNYYGPKPHIDGYGIKFFTNTDAMVQALLNNEIDMIYQTPPNAIEKLQANPNVTIAEGPGVTEDDFIFNSNPNKPNNPELLDPQVRLAFAEAIDKQQIVNVVRGGHAEPATTFIPPATGKWHNSDIQTEGYDINAANQILDGLGYKRGSDGIRVANGHPMAYDVITPNDVEGIDREFQIIQAGLQQIGVKVSQKSLDPTAAWNAIIAPNGKYEQFDLAIWDWIPLIDPDFMLSVLTTGQWNSWSDSAYSNPEYDKLYDQQGVTVDPKKRQDIVWQMQQMVFNDKPYIMLDYRNVIEAWSNKWAGYVMSPQGTWNSLSKATWAGVHQVG